MDEKEYFTTSKFPIELKIETSHFSSLHFHFFFFQMPDHLKAPLIEALSVPNNVRSMPNNALHPYPTKFDGVMVVGDAWNMRHPLTGAGMTVAFSDVALIRSILRKYKDLAPRHNFLAIRSEFIQNRKQAACALNTLAHGLYNVFKGDQGFFIFFFVFC